MQIINVLLLCFQLHVVSILFNIIGQINMNKFYISPFFRATRNLYLLLASNIYFYQIFATYKPNIDEKILVTSFFTVMYTEFILYIFKNRKLGFRRSYYFVLDCLLVLCYYLGHSAEITNTIISIRMISSVIKMIESPYIINYIVQPLAITIALDYHLSHNIFSISIENIYYIWLYSDSVTLLLKQLIY
jgi:hypothetical protein